MSKDAAGVLILAASTGRVLLARRSSSVRNPGTWSVFGGGLERGETEEEAAARELLEEAGLDFDGDDFDFLHEREKEGGGLYTTFFVLVEEEIWSVDLDGENDRFGWFALDDLPEPLHPGMGILFEETDLEEAIADFGEPIAY